VEHATFETLGEGKVRLTATIPAEQVDSAVAQVYRDASKKYKIPGFRPGKAPRSMVENLIGDDYARALATDKVVNDTFAQIVDAHDYRVIGQPDFDEDILLVEHEDFTYAVTFEVRPRLSLSDTAVSITMPPRVATQSEIDAQVDSIRRRFAQLKKVKSRKIKNDDIVKLSFTSTVDGEEYEGSTVEDYVYHLGQGMMPSQFEEAIVGAKPGDEVTAEFTIDAPEQDTEFAGKTISFTITLHEIQEPELPEVNDDLAVMSGFESADEMIAELKKTIDASKEQSYDNVLRSKLVSALAENLEGEVPQSLIDARTAFLKRDFESMLARNNIGLEQYLAMSNASAEEFDNDVATQAGMGVREELALEALADALGFTVTDDEIETELKILAADADIDIETARSRWKDAALMTPLRDELARRKALEWLVEHGEVTIDEEAM